MSINLHWHPERGEGEGECRIAELDRHDERNEFTLNVPATSIVTISICQEDCLPNAKIIEQLSQSSQQPCICMYVYEKYTTQTACNAYFGTKIML